MHRAAGRPSVLGRVECGEEHLASMRKARGSAQNQEKGSAWSSVLCLSSHGTVRDSAELVGQPLRAQGPADWASVRVITTWDDMERDPCEHQNSKDSGKS